MHNASDVYKRQGEVTLPYFGADSRVTPRDLAQMVDAVTDYSRYALSLIHI